MSAAADALKRGESVALVTVVRARGSTPQRAGAKMLVFADGRTVGTIGGGCYENEACLKAREVIDSGRQVLMHFELNDDFAQENGLICGGQMDVHVDPLEPAPRLYIIGAGHVGWHLARLAERARLSRARHRRPREIREPRALSRRRRDHRRADRRVAASRRDSGDSAYVVIVTRGHQGDLEAMRALAARDLRYLGLIGSRAKVARIRTVLLEEGMPSECLDRVHSPIGLDIGAVTPAEIAVSILAELIAVRRGVATAVGRDRRSREFVKSRRAQ